MRGGQENKKAADGGERAKARRSPGTAKGSSWPAPRAGLSRVFYLRVKLSSLPPLYRRRALHGSELDAPIMERKEVSRPVGRFGGIVPTYRANEGKFGIRLLLC